MKLPSFLLALIPKVAPITAASSEEKPPQDTTTAACHYVATGVKSLSEDNFEDARDYINEAIILDPNNSNAHILSAILHRQQNKTESMLEDCQRAISLLKEQPSLCERLAYVYRLRADYYHVLQQVDYAITDYMFAAYYSPQYMKGLPTNITSGELIRRGEASFFLDQFNEAQIYYCMAANIAPENDCIYEKLARVFLKLNEHQKALVQLNLSLRYNPNNIDSLLLQGEFYLSQCLFSKTHSIALKVIKLKPDSPRGYLLQAQIYEKQNNPLARNSYDQAVKVDNGREVLRLRIAYLDKIGDKEGAYQGRKALLLLLENNSPSEAAAVAVLIGKSLFEAKYFNEARGELNFALENTRDRYVRGLAFMLKGKICLETKQYNDALENFRNSVVAYSGATTYSIVAENAALKKLIGEAEALLARPPSDEPALKKRKPAQLSITQPENKAEVNQASLFHTQPTAAAVFSTPVKSDLNLEAPQSWLTQ